MPRAEHLLDKIQLYLYTDTAVSQYLYSCIRPRAAPRDHACMKLLLHFMRMLAARVCMVAAGSIKRLKSVPRCPKWRCPSTII
jgi:hypothetical protein